MNASINEPNKATVTTSGITSINFPRVPEILSIGRNAAIILNVNATIGQKTSLAPIFDAAIGSIPFSICLYVFSVTMIASSTTIPKATRNANNETIFIVKPKIYIPNAATKNDTGIPNAVIKATLEFRKKYNERSNKDRPIIPEDLTVSSLVFTFNEKSLKALDSKPDGKE